MRVRFLFFLVSFYSCHSYSSENVPELPPSFEAECDQISTMFSPDQEWRNKSTNKNPFRKVVFNDAAFWDNKDKSIVIKTPGRQSSFGESVGKKTRHNQYIGNTILYSEGSYVVAWPHAKKTNDRRWRLTYITNLDTENDKVPSKMISSYDIFMTEAGEGRIQFYVIYQNDKHTQVTLSAALNQCKYKIK